MWTYARRIGLLGFAMVFGAGCPGVTPQGDAGDVPASDAADAAPADTPVDAPPPAPGSNEALTREACEGVAPSTSGVVLSYATGEPMGRLQNTATGDLEAVHVIPTEPTRVTRLRVNVRGGMGGSARVRLLADYGRSQPDVDTDLMPAATITFAQNGWVDVPVDPPVLLHPARHAWIVLEHVTEPMGLAVGMGTGASRVSSVFSAAIIADLRAMGEQFFTWVQVSDTADYLAEAHGTSVCGPRTNPWFTDVSTTAGLDPMVGDASWADVDNDGHEDAIGILRVAMMPDRPAVLRNRGDGTFTNVTAMLGLDTAIGTLAMYADYDGDGDEDAFVGDYQAGLGPFDPARGSRIWVQGTDGRFTRTDAALESPGPTASVAVGDCNGDGILDLAIGQWLRQYPQNPAPDFVFRGVGDGTFTNITSTAGLPAAGNNRPTYGMNFADYDDDGDVDLFIANYGGSPNELWQNNGQCRLTNVARRGGLASDDNGQAGTSFGFELGDYDNDGDLDAFESNIGHPRYDDPGTDHSRLLRNTGAPDHDWEDVTAASGLFYTEGDIAGAWGDYDNDGDLDLYVATTYPWQFSRLYRQEQDHTFTDVTYLAGVGGANGEINGRAAFYDYDRDGDLDLLTAPRARQTLFRNNLPRTNHWIQIRLRGAAPNTDALGARITVTSPSLGAQRRDVSAGRTTYGSQSPRLQHFGLGAQSAPVTLTVRWPDGMTATHENIAVDRIYVIARGEAPRAL